MSCFGNMGAPAIWRSAPEPGIRVGWVRIRVREVQDDGRTVERVEHYGGRPGEPLTIQPPHALDEADRP